MKLTNCKKKGPVAGAFQLGDFFEEGFLMEGVDDQGLSDFLEVLDYEVHLGDVLGPVASKDLLEYQEFIILEAPV